MSTCIFVLVTTLVQAFFVSAPCAKVPEPGAGLLVSRDAGALFLPDGGLLAADSSRVWTLWSRDGVERRWPGLPARAGATAMGAPGFGRDVEIAILTAGDTIERYSIAGERTGRVSLSIPDAREIALVPGRAGDPPFLLAWSDRALCAVDTTGRAAFSWDAPEGDTITGVAWTPGPAGRLVAIAAGASVHLLREDGSYVPGWPVSIDQPLVSPPLFPVWSSGAVLCADRLGRVFAWKFTGQAHDGWPFETSTWNTRVSLAAADWDGDGRDEIFVAASEGYWVATEIGSAWPETPVYSRSAAILDPLVFDIDADSTLELLGGTEGYGTFVLEPDGRVFPTPWGERFVPLLAEFRNGSPVVAGLTEDAWVLGEFENGGPASEGRGPSSTSSSIPSRRGAAPAITRGPGWIARGGDPLRSNGRAALRLQGPEIVMRSAPGLEECAGEEGLFEILVRNPAPRTIANARLALSGPAGSGFEIPIGSIPALDSIAVRFRAPTPLVADTSEAFLWSIREGGRRLPGAIDTEWRVEANAPADFERLGGPGPRVESLAHHDGFLTRLAGDVVTTTDRSGRVIAALSTTGRAFAWGEEALFVLRGDALFRLEEGGDEHVAVSPASGGSVEAILVLDSFFVFVDTSCAPGHELQLVSRSTGERRYLGIPPARGVAGFGNSLFARVPAADGSRLVEWRLPGGEIAERSDADEDVRAFSIGDRGLVLAVETGTTSEIRLVPHGESTLETVLRGLEAAPVAVALSDSFVVWQTAAGTGSAWEVASVHGDGRCRMARLQTQEPVPLSLAGSWLAFADDAPGFLRSGSVRLPPADRDPRNLFRWRDPEVRSGAIVVAWEAGGVEPEDRFVVVRTTNGKREKLATVRASGREEFAIVDSDLPTHHAGLLSEYGIIWIRGLTPVDSLPALRVEVPRTIEAYELAIESGNPIRSRLRLSVRVPYPGKDALRVELFDVSGRRVASRAVDSARALEEIVFDEDGRRELSSGIYFARLVGSRGVLDSRKVVLLR